MFPHLYLKQEIRLHSCPQCTSKRHHHHVMLLRITKVPAWGKRMRKTTKASVCPNSLGRQATSSCFPSLSTVTSPTSMWHQTSVPLPSECNDSLQLSQMEWLVHHKLVWSCIISVEQASSRKKIVRVGKKEATNLSLQKYSSLTFIMHLPNQKAEGNKIKKKGNLIAILDNIIVQTVQTISWSCNTTLFGEKKSVGCTVSMLSL